ncbi:hypothetical protein B0H14DRAFT_3468439 [Mycena olivaceomarginata]|nr:hypothetical protein B0H14DRAFT_3468439 [Mycena olivaceomarginata]
MSIRELRVRIDELSREIDLQKELMTKLEKDKSLVQHRLNAVVDPVARLPLEISSQIFLHILDPSPVPKPADLHQESDDYGNTVKVNLFNGTTPGPLPLLETLTVVNSTLAPKIDNCSFHNCHGLGATTVQVQLRVVMSTLRRLMFGHRGKYPDGDANSLDHFSHPSLEARSVSITGGDKPRLYHQCLHLIPSLARFEIWSSDAPVVANLFAALAGSPSLPPNLHTFAAAIRSTDPMFGWKAPPVMSDSWRPFLRVVSARPH